MKNTGLKLINILTTILLSSSVHYNISGIHPLSTNGAYTVSDTDSGSNAWTSKLLVKKPTSTATYT